MKEAGQRRQSLFSDFLPTAPLSQGGHHIVVGSGKPSLEDTGTSDYTRISVPRTHQRLRRKKSPIRPRNSSSMRPGSGTTTVSVPAEYSHASPMELRSGRFM